MSSARAGAIDQDPSGTGLGDAFAAARTRTPLIALLLVLAALGWWSTAGSMAGMDAGPGTDLGGFGWFLSVWVVMMAAMMLPAVSPTVALYAQMTGSRGPARPLLFTAGYLLLWGSAGAAAYGVFALASSVAGGKLDWNNGGRWLAGAVLVGAAVYELTPLKDVCLRKCRSPVGFLVSAWREGRRGALEMGIAHAAWCLGCCLALMAALFALGVMSVAWMAFVAVLITAQKMLPWRRVATWTTAALLLVLATLVMATPGSVPGLVVPNGAQSTDAMEAMH